MGMTFCASRFVSFNLLRIFRRIFIGICHRFISPLIFLFVYYFYQIFNSRKILSNITFSKIFIIIFTYLLNLRFPLLRRFLSELYIFTFILSFGSVFLNFISLICFVLPIIFTFSMIIIFSKYFEKVFVNIFNPFSIILSFRLVLASILLVYSAFSI